MDFSLFSILSSVLFGLLGFGFAAFITILFFLLIAPVFVSAGWFVNEPKGMEKSGVHFFTKLSPGQVKIIVRGKRPIRMIMNTAGKKFARGNHEVDSAEYWQIEDGESEDPTLDILPILRPWAQFVYNTTGAVFTGIYPFQRVYEYELERTEVKRDEEAPGDSNLVLIVKNDISDHFRTRQFLYPMHITAAETNDKIPLDIVGVAEMQVENPHLAAYGTDRWDQAVINLVTDAITSKTKQMTVDQALTAGNESDARQINEAVESIQADQLECGIQINAFRILEINPVLSEAAKEKLQAEALAKQQAKATRVDGQARADVIREINKANAEGGEQSLAAMESEAFVRAADAAGKGGGTVILMPQQGKGNHSVDPTQAAILAELKGMNRRNKQERK